MKHSRFSEEQIVAMLKENEAGASGHLLAKQRAWLVLHQRYVGWLRYVMLESYPFHRTIDPFGLGVEHTSGMIGQVDGREQVQISTFDSP